MEALILTPDSSPLSRNIEDYPEGIIIPIDKPYRWTSADVIRKVKYAAIRHFGKKNLKVGHAGTLDPLATGVLLVCIGKATKLAETLQSHDKEYVAGVTFGATTPSYDLEKEIDRFFPHEHITAETIEAALPAFIGEQDQIAPLFSAKSVDGVRAYELARRMYRIQNGCNSEDPRLSDPATAGCSLQKPTGLFAQPLTTLAGGGMSSTSQSISDECPTTDIDAAAKELIRVARINISELELLGLVRQSAASEDPRLSNDRHPLAGGGMSSTAVTLPHSDSNQATLMECNTGVDNASGGNEIEKNASSRINVTDNSALGLPRAEIRMACSKGTYVRAFARDLGEALGSGAHLDSLQRSRSGQFRVENALTVDQAIELLRIP